jgi:hypothetical protein
MTVSVEHLRKAADFMKQASGVDPGWLREAADEIDRLREALESLTEDPPATLDEPDHDWEVIIKMRNIAREALGLPHGPTFSNGDH